MHLQLMLLGWFAFPVYLQAQQFRFQCRLDTVRQTGFYSIPVTPELSAHLQTDFSDVRIWDEKKKPVPYIVRKRKPKWQNNLFKPFPIIENSLDDSANSVIVFEKNIPEPIQQFWIIQKNSSVLREASLSGSNDKKNWFIINRQVLLNERFEALSDSNFQPIGIASSDYKYFRLKINNEKEDPLNIVRIGQYLNPEYTIQSGDIRNPDPVFSQNDSSNGYTYVKLTQKQPYHVSSLGFEIVGQKYFARDMEILIAADKARLKKKPLTAVTRYVLSNGTLDGEDIPLFKSREFYLVIYNGDNPPMEIGAVHTGQEYHEIIAWLEKDKPYTLMMDATDATAPQYDLQQFSDSIPAVVPPIATNHIMPVSAAQSLTEKEGFPKAGIWLMMAGVIALLGLLTWRLTTEMRKKTNSE